MALLLGFRRSFAIGLNTPTTHPKHTHHTPTTHPHRRYQRTAHAKNALRLHPNACLTRGQLAIIARLQALLCGNTNLTHFAGSYVSCVLSLPHTRGQLARPLEIASSLVAPVPKFPPPLTTPAPRPPLPSPYYRHDRRRRTPIQTARPPQFLRPEPPQSFASRLSPAWSSATCPAFLASTWTGGGEGKRFETKKTASTRARVKRRKTNHIQAMRSQATPSNAEQSEANAKQRQGKQSNASWYIYRIEIHRLRHGGDYEKHAAQNECSCGPEAQ